MMPTNNLTPDVIPMATIVPPPQTVIGTLAQDGLPSKFETKMPGQGPNQDFWFARDEYVGIFSLNTNQNIETRLADIDPLRVTSQFNNPQLMPRLQSSYPDNTAWSISLPRTLAFNTAVYFNSPISISFWAIKPLGTRGKLRIVYSPFNRKSRVTEQSLAVSTVPSYVNEDSHMRNMVWSWDLEKQDTFHIMIHGNNPLSTFPTTDELQVNTILTSLVDDNNAVNDTGRPRFQTTYGTLSVFVQNRYTPGSIFPGEIDIVVFKSFPGCKTYVERGPRVHSQRMVL